MITVTQEVMRRRRAQPSETEIMGGPDKPGHDDM